MGFFRAFGNVLKTGLNVVKDFFITKGVVDGGGGSSYSSSSSTTTYDPDKVKVAEIEHDTKIRLANMEQERIELMKQARLDILEFETQSKIALEQARAQGLATMAQTIIAMQEKLNAVAEQRLLIIEKGSLPIVREIEAFYEELGAKVQEDNEKYNTEKMPQMLSILEKYEEGSPAHKLYFKRIEEDSTMQMKHYWHQVDAIAARQSQVINGFLSSKEKIIEQTGAMTAGLLEAVQKQTLELNGESTTGESSANLLEGGEKLALPQGGNE